MSVAADLHRRLQALGHDVRRPVRIYLGRGFDNGDWWRWQAKDCAVPAVKIGCNLSMRECVRMSDEELQQRIETNS